MSETKLKCSKQKYFVYEGFNTVPIVPSPVIDKHLMTEPLCIEAVIWDLGVKRENPVSENHIC